MCAYVCLQQTCGSFVKRRDGVDFFSDSLGKSSLFTYWLKLPEFPWGAVLLRSKRPSDLAFAAVEDCGDGVTVSPSSCLCESRLATQRLLACVIDRPILPAVFLSCSRCFSRVVSALPSSDRMRFSTGVGIQIPPPAYYVARPLHQEGGRGLTSALGLSQVNVSVRSVLASAAPLLWSNRDVQLGRGGFGGTAVAGPNP